MKRLFAVLLTLCMLCASALADSLTTNGGVTLDTADLPYCTADESPNLSSRPIMPWAWSCPAR